MASFFASLKDEGLAREYIHATLPHRRELDDLPIPLHKWLWAIYLTDGGRVHVPAKHLSAVLDIPMVIATAVLERLARSKDELTRLMAQAEAASPLGVVVPISD